MTRRRNLFQFLKNTTAVTAVATLCMSTAFADDTEVFFGQVDPSLDVFPNVLFVLDTSGSMNWTDGGSETRLERMKDALDTILDNATNVNIGLMRFNGTSGGGAVLFPITPIDEQICDQDNCGEISSAPRISGGWNDVEERVSDGDMFGDSGELDIGVGERGAELVGIQFDDIGVPQGATITSARIEFTANRSDSSSANFQITGELVDDTSPFNNDDANVSSRNKTTTSVNWTPPNWSQGSIYQTNDISSVMQEIVDQAGWCGGNSLSLFLEGSGLRRAKSFENSATAAPALKFTYDSASVPNGAGCTQKTEVATIAAGSDDAEQDVRRGRTNPNSGDLEMPYDRNKEQVIGLRFTDIKIPKNAVITDASIEFEVDRQRGGTVSVNIQGQSSDNPATFQSTWRNISNRPRTAATVAWNNIPNLPTNSKVSAENLEPIVQELVNRSGWQSGNAMAFIITKRSANNYRSFETFDSEPVNAPKLRITYQAQVGDSEPTYITARDKLKESVNSLTATGGTPIVDAYWEASRYYRGASVDYGKQRGSTGRQNRFHRVSVPESYTGGTVYRQNACTDGDLDNPYCWNEKINGNPTYISPFKSSCQTNHIVFLSDGAATSNSAAAKVRSQTGVSTCDTNSGSQACGTELANWLHENDHAPNMTGKQNVTTYTIGFNFSSGFLESLATAGGGAYFQADSAAQLVDVFQTILGDVLSVDTSFVAPGATVNQFNRLTHRNDIYFALFKPGQRPTWSGNLKRYEVGADSDGKVTIKDVAGNAAVDPSSGFFDENSHSWWSDSADGNQVAKGGAADEMEYDNGNPRKIFTYLGDTSALPAGGATLNTSANALHENNNHITLAHLGLSNATGTPTELQDYRDNLLKWARGVDVKDDDEDGETDDWRQHMGDPMHARPVIVNYANGDNDPLTTVFVGTNEGYLHAIERDHGKEIYSYVPKQLLPNFDTFWNNQSSDSHPYGLDGTLSVWTSDENGNVTIDPGEKAYLYTGMRRGGSAYFSLDVSERLNPKLNWVIEGGTGDFAELGQTWSKLAPARIRFNGLERDVLIFGAGYDDNQDMSLDTDKNRVPRSEDSKGRGIYIVDAEDGSLVYSALGVTGAPGAGQVFDDMDYSIPSDIRILDTDFDGFADQMYASDLGGRIWRFDFETFHESGDLLYGGIIADLSTSGLEGERRFYYEPDVAMISNDGNRFLSISIGSGWRAHPLDLIVDDKFFMIKSASVFSRPPGYGKTLDNGQTYQPITVDDLVDVTNTLTPPINNYGWQYDLGATGEKVLGDSVTVNNQVVFSSYRPALSVGACTTAIGGGSVYALNILDGSPTVDLDGDGDIDEDDREMKLAHGGIPPSPAVLITPDGPTLLVGPEQPFQPNFVNLTRRTFWVDSSDSYD